MVLSADLVVEGRNLAPKDQNGLSDPFLTFGPIDKKGNWAFLEKRSKPFKSKTTRKTLNPVWRMPFEIPVDANCKGFRVEVWDWDMIGTDFMGQVVIQIADLPKGRESESWYKLVARNSKKDVVSGEVLIRILYSQDTEKLNLGGMMGTSASKRMMDAGSPTPSSSNALPNIGEEEYSAMDDMRSGEIDLIMPALFKYAASLPCLQIGLPCLAKWATTSSVAERIEFLEKHQASFFDFLIQSATEFKNDAVVVFYALHTFGPFLRLIEAKQYFTSTVASLLANSLQEPPSSLSPDDRARHCTNCLISLANACTSNLKELKNQNKSQAEIDRALAATAKCEQIVASSGALRVALSLLKSNDTVTKHILALVIKMCQTLSVKRLLQEFEFASTATSILMSSSDPTLIWLALDAIAKYTLAPEGQAPSTVKDYLADVSKTEKLLPALARVASLEVFGIHSASVNTGIVYLLHALAHQYTNGVWEAKNIDSNLLKLLLSRAGATYTEFIPKAEQKPLLPERSLQLLCILGKQAPELQNKFVEELPATIQYLVHFWRFPSVLSAASTYIKMLIEANVITKASASDHILATLKNDDFDETAKNAITAFAEAL
jgi:hypothetical protein